MPVCLNHSYAEDTSPCDACARPFCNQCLVSILGKRYCRECKVTQFGAIVRRPTIHPLATAAWVVPLVGWIFVGLVVPITSPVGFYLGLRALRELEDQPHLGGRSAAKVGIVLSAATFISMVIGIAGAYLLRTGKL